MPKCDENIGVRVTTRMRDELEQRAENEDRKLSDQIRRYIKQGLRRDRDADRKRGE